MQESETSNPPSRQGDGPVPAPGTPLVPEESGPLAAPAPVSIDSDRPLLDLVKIAGPSVATMSSYTIMQFVDTFMVKQIGPDPVYVAAQGNGGIVAWVFVALALGTNTVINSFVSQHLGAGTPERGAAYAWNGIWLSVVYALLVLIPAAVIAPSFIPPGHAPLLVELETRYAQILLYGAVLTIAARSIHHYFYGLHRPGIVLAAAVSGNLVNIGVNAVLIFGEQGMPLPESGVGRAIFTPISVGASWIAGQLGVQGMGIAGAAIGTVVGGAIEFVIPMVVFLSRRYARMYGTRAAWLPKIASLRDILRVGWPGGLMMVNELVCWGLLMAWLVPQGGSAGAAHAGLDPESAAHAGTIANTSGWIALRYMHLSFMPTVGISIGAQAMVGKAMGAGRPDIARARAMLALKLSLAYMGLCALCFVVFRAQLISVFINGEMPPEDVDAIIAVGSRVMIAAAVFQLFDAVAITLSGALRGAGDTVWPGVLTVVLSWTCIVGVGLALIEYAPQLGSMGPWIGASLYIIMLGVMLAYRFQHGGWERMSLVGNQARQRA